MAVKLAAEPSLPVLRCAKVCFLREAVSATTAHRSRPTAGHVLESNRQLRPLPRDVSAASAA
eukprot:CAMPEP_0171881618 /NCGR_PEP_ID=MMETSP0992-20121227/39124_1 /TAXON_ID=483369 /ORGANISM="non described non described, Strain CCMP2098" /LENGTH=61 /DNA_ID=CAMNT_0012507543 /DNA_START=77 /DNA_END=258 /DNA_ORIENTATION=-